MHFFFALFFTLFAVNQQSQPPSPAPRKPAHTNQSGASPEQKKTSANDQTTTDLISAMNQLTAAMAAENQQQSREQTDKKSPSDGWAIANAILVTIFTGALAILAFLQWKAMHRQADIYDRQREILDKQAEISAKQLSIIESEKDVANQRYSEQLELATKQANTARQSADVLIASERAWVSVTIDWSPGYSGLFISAHMEHGHTVHGYMTTVRMTYKNDGRTPAWINERRANLEIFNNLPDTPPIERAEIIKHGIESLAAGQEKSFDTPLSCEGTQTMDNLAVIYGVVKYRTAVGIAGESVFGYRISFGGTNMFALDYQEWNNNS